MDDIKQACNGEQVMEIEILSSMYTESELVFATCNSENSDSGFKLLNNFTLRLVLNNRKLDVSVQLPQLYPLIELPHIYVRSEGNFCDKELNSELRRWLDEHEKGSAMITDVVLWITENAENFLVNNEIMKQIRPADDTFSRYFIWTHHIYSNTKRANLVSIAKGYGLRGFSTPGKPAIILIEGLTSLCESYWIEIKTWNWMKIKLVGTEILTSKKDFKFPAFYELLLPTTDNKHVNIGPVRTMLAEMGLENRFTMLYNL